MKSLAPIVLFVYNRPWHTEQTLEALMANELANESILYIYADGPKINMDEHSLLQINLTRQILRKKQWCKEVHFIERVHNLGLAENVIDGVSHIVNKYGNIIVLEDDIITSIGFLKYMNEALTLYENIEKVMHISGYMFPVKEKLPETFFYNTASCWGWATWQRAWKYYDNDASKSLALLRKRNIIEKFNIEDTYNFFEHLEDNANGTLKTWAVRWYASFFLQSGYALHPYPSLVNNIGHDGLGENCGLNNYFDWSNLAKYITVKMIPLEENMKARENMRIFNKALSMPVITKSNSIKLLLRKSISLLVPNLLKHQYRLKKHIDYKLEYQKHEELKRLKQVPRYIIGKSSLLEKPISFIDSASLLFIHDELFNKEIYKFKSENSKPYIIDAGANIGLSVIYFKSLYPNAEIIAFEPDSKAFEALETNVKTFNFEKVTLIKKALWNEETTLRFYSEGADGGRIANSYEHEQIINVETIRLRDFLCRNVDFLKIDIEGAETAVLEDCTDLFHNVKNIFVEYHSFKTQEQYLSKLLNILTKAGFRYQIQHIGVFSPHPFINIEQYSGMDLQLNIFAYK